MHWYSSTRVLFTVRQWTYLSANVYRSADAAYFKTSLFNCALFQLASRFLSCPQKKKFWLDVLNIIDLIAIIPYFVTTGSQLSALSKQCK